MILNLVEAINLGLKQEMQKDKSVIILGEDVGIDGGVFRVTDGLLKKFGPERVIDTPLAESGIIGMSIGMAMSGLKPVAECQFEGFMLPAFDQLVNHAARIRNRSRGRFSCPLVLRSPFGGMVRAFEHHSESPESYYVHTPGLKVVIPSTPYDAKGLIVSAIRDPDPVIFFEPKRIYRAIKQEVPEKEYTIPIGKANIRKEGDDLTLISWGAMVRECEKALENIKANIEFIDLRTVKPLDVETIINSVKKTGKVVIVQEAPKTLGLASEIISIINDKALLSLEAPVERITGFDTIVPLARLEKYHNPSVERIVYGINKVLKY
ncbi:alpha-ketoacid dehydrogenase subunit beta [Candidatus Woesearchaeota archaeon]|nr:alpha-ketoacid dehydrogenase subunit beta [Candidatus Woesearchaeota archaeon]